MRNSLYILIFFLVPLLSFSQEVPDSTDIAGASPEDTTATKIVRLKINSAQSDFSPYIMNDQLLFVSGRNKHLGVQYVDVNNDSEITDLYTSTKVNPSKFKNVNSLGSVNTKYYEGPFCMNKQGTIIYYTANDKRSSLLKIYKSEKKENKWSDPEVMPFCLPDFSYCHPAISPNEDFMIFSTNMDKEKNGMDLYISKFRNGSWTLPGPLGSNINDSANQVFPFISSNKILYFSSDKKDGLGGLDIYYINLNYDSSVVRALKYPLNSGADDFGVWIDSTSESGYFSSNRMGRSKDDIYYFTRSVPDFSDARTVIPKTKYCYSFFEESTLATKDTINLTYEWKFGDGQKGRGLRSRHCYAGPGTYPVELNIIDKESGEVFISETSYQLEIEKPDLVSIHCSDSIVAGQELLISAAACYLKGYELTKIYWSFGDGKYNSGQAVKHTYKKQGTYTLEIGILAKNLSSGKVEQFKGEKKIVAITKT
jgi:hypothetical protein